MPSSTDRASSETILELQSAIFLSPDSAQIGGFTIAPMPRSVGDRLRRTRKSLISVTKE